MKIKNKIPGYACLILILALTCLLCLSGCSNAQTDVEIPQHIETKTVQAAEENNTEITPETDISLESPDSDTNKVLFSFTVCGDNRPADDYLPQPEVFARLLNLIKDENSAFHINTGDIINGGTADEKIIKRQFSDYLAAVKILPVANFISPGNHDIANDTARKYFQEMLLKKAFRESTASDIKIFIPGIDTPLEDENTADNLYYYFEFGDVYFLILNSFEKGYWGAIKLDQLTWLEDVLGGLKDKVVFVFIHSPVYSVMNPDTITDGSRHVAFSSRENQDHIRDLFKNCRVDGVFSGHEHFYNKQFHDGTVYVITALSGVYPVRSEEEGGFYHYIRVDIKKDSWVLNVIDSNESIRCREEMEFN